MDLIEDIGTQLSEIIRALEQDIEDLKQVLSFREEPVTEELEERVKTNAASLIAATGAYRALDEALRDDDDEED